MSTSITLLHTAPLSLEDCIAHFTQPSLLRNWFCGYVEEGDDNDLFLAWGQHHYVMWKLKEVHEAKIIIEQQYMGKVELSTEIVIEFESLGSKTKLAITHKNVSPEMEQGYRSDWSGLQYLGIPRPSTYMW